MAYIIKVMDIRNDIKYLMAKRAMTFKRLAILMTEKNWQKILSKRTFFKIAT